MVDLHGYIEGAAIHAANSRIEISAETDGYVAVTPQGTGAAPYWNAGPTADGPDDLAFLGALLDDVGTDLCIDLGRIYATGLSNGAMMTSLLACRMADRFAGIGMVAGLMMPHDCHPSRAVPLVVFHGTADPLVSYDQDGPSPGSSTLPFTPEAQHNFDAVHFQATTTAFRQWGELDGCATTAPAERIAADVTRTVSSGCRDGATLTLYTIEGGGHTWPGSPFLAGNDSILGPTTVSIDANAVQWAAFRDLRS